MQKKHSDTFLPVAGRKKTVEIINYVETHKRNFYTGVSRYFNSKDLDSFIMIRFIENQTGEYFFKSGGGITGLSKVKNEYQEMIDKVYIQIKNLNKAKVKYIFFDSLIYL